MEVRVQNSSLVQIPADAAALAPHHQLIWMSNLDVITAEVYIQTVYFYQTPADAATTTPAHAPPAAAATTTPAHACPPQHAARFFPAPALKSALAQALSLFYPYAGRLQPDMSSPDRRNCVNCNNHGALFVEATSSVTIEYFGEFGPSSLYRPLVPQPDRSKDISTQPLLLLQVTSFKCGGVAIGVNMHHHLADGKAALNFVNTWAKIARGDTSLSKEIPPFMDRTLLRARVPPHPCFEHVEYQFPPAVLETAAKLGEDVQQGGGAQELAKATLHLTKQQVVKIREKAKDKERKEGFSTFVALTAHVWRCISKARGLDKEQQSKVYVAVDGRARLEPPLPDGYFGNVLFSATPIVKVGELVDQPLAYGAREIQDSISKLTNDYLRSALDYLELQPNLPALRRGPHTFKSPNLGITTWTKFPVFEADFGWGKPIYMGPAEIGFEGLVYILPNPKDHAAVDITLVLHTSAMARFKKALYEF